MPTPASESFDAFGSPVPAYSVLPDGSRLSISNDPIALVAKLPETNCQFRFPASASLVFQMPPPAAPTNSGHAPGLQLGPIAIAVTRPLVTYCAPSNRNGLSTAGYVALLGPISCHAPFEWPLAFIAAHPFCAASVAAPGTSVSGYARSRYASTPAL